MLSYIRGKKGIQLTKYLCAVEKSYQIAWRQMVSKEGKIYGIGGFTYKKIPEQKRGNWSKTLQKRMKARYEKRGDWKNHIQKEQAKEDKWSKTLQNRINARHEKGENWKNY